MRTRFNITGDLWYDVLNDSRIVSYDYSTKNEVWTVLARSYKDPGIDNLTGLKKESPPEFTVYRMDAAGIFGSVEKWDGREPLLLARYKKKYEVDRIKGRYVPRPPKLGEPIWYKGMSAGEFDALNGGLRRAQHELNP